MLRNVKQLHELPRRVLSTEDNVSAYMFPGQKRNLVISVYSDTFAMGLLILTPTQTVRVVDSVISILPVYSKSISPTQYTDWLLTGYPLSILYITVVISTQDIESFQNDAVHRS